MNAKTHTPSPSKCKNISVINLGISRCCHSACVVFESFRIERVSVLIDVFIHVHGVHGTNKNGALGYKITTSHDILRCHMRDPVTRGRTVSDHFLLHADSVWERFTVLMETGNSPRHMIGLPSVKLLYDLSLNIRLKGKNGQGPVKGDSDCI